jgi:hypothetical protein
MADQHELCNCGAEPTVIYGPDIRFSPPCSNPKMWRAQCSANDCMDSPSFTAFTRDRALELWDQRMRDTAVAPSEEQKTCTPTDSSGRKSDGDR